MFMHKHVCVCGASNSRIKLRVKKPGPVRAMIMFALGTGVTDKTIAMTSFPNQGWPAAAPSKPLLSSTQPVLDTPA